MFQHLFQLEKKRTRKQAIGFYIAYFFLSIVFGMLGALIFVPFIDAGFESGLHIGEIMVTIFCLVLSTGILFAKRLAGNPLYWLAVLGIGVCATLGGAILGLIPIAYLTTKPIATHSSHRS